MKTNNILFLSAAINGLSAMSSIQPVVAAEEKNYYVKLGAIASSRIAIRRLMCVI